MSTLPAGVQIYLLLSVLVSGLAHWKLKRYFVSCGLTAIIGPAMFSLACALHGDGISWPGLKIALFFSAVSLIVAALVGLLFLVQRRLFRAQPIP